MDQLVSSFTNIPWRQSGPNCRVKEIAKGSQQLRLVEFQRGFEEDGWCETGHVGYVLEGCIDIELPDQTVRANAGDSVWIPAGYESRHRAHVIGDSAQLLFFESSNS